MSYCGISCNSCRNYKQNMNCQGCYHETELIQDCPVRECGMLRGLEHCGRCSDFPCEMLDKFYNDGNPLHLKAYRNMLNIVNQF